MKILIISPGVLPVPAIKGGAVENLIEILLRSKEVTTRHDVTLYTIYDKEIDGIEKDLNYNVKYIYTKGKIYQLKKVIRHIINKFSKSYIGNQYIHSVIKGIKKENQNYDIIIVENVPEYGLVLKNIKGKSKLILHLHNDFLNKYKKNAVQIEEAYDSIFSVSKYIKQRVDEINPKSKKNEVLYNGIDTNRFNPEIYDKNKIRKKYGFSTNDFIFMYSGRLVEEKGVKEMIQAFCEIKNKRCKLLILGKGNENYYKELISVSKPREKDVIFKGFINYDKIPEVYSLVDVGVVPSTWNEPFGLVVIEFLASGIPVIVSDKGAMREIINIEDVCGELVKKDENYINNLKNAMLYYLELKKETMEQRKKNSIMNSKKFTKEIYVNKFLTLIEEENSEQKK